MRFYIKAIGVLAISVFWVGCANKLNELSSESLDIPVEGQVYKLGSASINASPLVITDENQPVETSIDDVDIQLPAMMARDGETPLSSVSEYLTLKLVPNGSGYDIQASAPDQQGCVVTITQELLSVGTGDYTLGAMYHKSTCSLGIEDKLNEIASKVSTFFKKAVHVKISQNADSSLELSVADIQASEYVNSEVPAEEDFIVNAASLKLMPISESSPTVLIPDFTATPSE